MTLSTSISLGLLWLLFAFFYRSYRVDYVREKLFTLRDELFSLAESGEGISFQDDAYIMLRSRINSTIRYAHRMTAVDFACMLFSVRNDNHAKESAIAYERQWEKSCSTVATEVAKKLGSISLRVRLEVIQQVLFTSSLFWLLVAPAVGFFVFKVAARSAMNAVVRSAKAVSLVDQFDVASGQAAALHG